MGEFVFSKVHTRDIFASLGFTAAADTQEADWPKTSVQLVCAYAAGGGTDLFARMMAQGLSDVGKKGTGSVFCPCLFYIAGISFF